MRRSAASARFRSSKVLRSCAERRPRFLEDLHVLLGDGLGHQVVADDAQLRDFDVVLGLFELGIAHRPGAELFTALLVDLFEEVAEFRFAIARRLELAVAIEFDQQVAALDERAGAGQPDDDQLAGPRCRAPR